MVQPYTGEVDEVGETAVRSASKWVMRLNSARRWRDLVRRQRRTRSVPKSSTLNEASTEP